MKAVDEIEAPGSYRLRPVLSSMCGRVRIVHWALPRRDRCTTLERHRLQPFVVGCVAVAGRDASWWPEVQDPERKERQADECAPVLLIETLEAHRLEQQKSRALYGADYRTDLDLIIALPDGSPWSPDTFSGAYSDFSERIGMKGVRFHDLRHSHASHMLRSGVPVKTVQERLGHANASITLNTYAHVRTGDDERAVELVEQRLCTAINRQFGLARN